MRTVDEDDSDLEVPPEAILLDSDDELVEVALKDTADLARSEAASSTDPVALSRQQQKLDHLRHKTKVMIEMARIDEKGQCRGRRIRALDTPGHHRRKNSKGALAFRAGKHLRKAQNSSSLA
ncbi:unnamed protein product [Protopolystoma xenopodis]|uniref:Uncharacterized protein n=1 Tax=Protopolystoma xenopodis TaxID=117903 RepID=A0A3S5C058_9PLAT|nr:unnamed protein product [Protopolystoma xenopodis]